MKNKSKLPLTISNANEKEIKKNTTKTFIKVNEYSSDKVLTYPFYKPISKI